MPVSRIAGQFMVTSHSQLTLYKTVTNNDNYASVGDAAAEQIMSAVCCSRIQGSSDLLKVTPMLIFPPVKHENCLVVPRGHSQGC